ncbi:TetR family transcriptional regulator [Ruegeria sp. Ofav3-42]|uniref:TetR family transcriptional regulator n=1 Tax=Ruegeria sp. Ofav3-42 TaxID=2917759 RepID=UPI00351CF76B
MLEAARQVVKTLVLDATIMTDLAKEAGVVKSAMYRYFKSKEETPAYLPILEVDKMTNALKKELAGCADLPQAANCFAKVISKQPLFCALSSDFARILERNIAHDRLVTIKYEFVCVLGDWADALLKPGVVKEKPVAVQFIRSAYVVLAGLWPMKQDRPVVQSAAKEAGLAENASSFEDDFCALLGCLANGMTAQRQFAKKRVPLSGP